MNYKERLYQTALDQYFKSNMYSPGMIQCAVDIATGDDGSCSKKVLEIIKELKRNDKRQASSNKRHEPDTIK